MDYALTNYISSPKFCISYHTYTSFKQICIEQRTITAYIVVLQTIMILYIYYRILLFIKFVIDEIFSYIFNFCDKRFTA